MEKSGKGKIALLHDYHHELTSFKRSKKIVIIQTRFPITMTTWYNCWIIYIVCGGLLTKLSDSYDPTDWNPPGSSVHGISQARALERAAISSTGGTSWSRDQTHVSYVSCIAGRFFICWAIMEAPLHSSPLNISLIILVLILPYFPFKKIKKDKKDWYLKRIFNISKIIKTTNSNPWLIYCKWLLFSYDTLPPLHLSFIF